jgi:hypothetical protein
MARKPAPRCNLSTVETNALESNPEYDYEGRPSQVNQASALRLASWSRSKRIGTLLAVSATETVQTGGSSLCGNLALRDTS